MGSGIESAVIDFVSLRSELKNFIVAMEVDGTCLDAP